jgi:hypothetical protein
VSDGEKADVIRQVSDGKMSASESLLTHRKGFQSLSKRVEVADARNSVDVTPPAYGPHGSRCSGDMSPSQASVWNVGTCHGVSRESFKWPQPRGQIPRPMPGTEQLVVVMKGL